MGSGIRSIRTNEFARVRLGINPGADRVVPDFLLQPFRREQRAELESFLDYAAQAVVSIVSEGVEMAMTRFNRRAQGERTEEE